MAAKRPNKLAFSWIALGGALLALWAIRDELPASLHWSHTPALVGGASLTAVGVALVVFPLNWLARLSRGWMEDPPRRTRRAREADLEPLRAYCVEFFGEDIADLNRMRSWYQVNKDLFWIVERIRRDGKTRSYELVGYFCMVPLNKAASQLVETEMLNGTQFLNNHIIHRGGKYKRTKPHSVYIGGIAATGFRARGHTLGALQSRIEVEREAGAKLAYSRPLTERGMELIKKYGFTCVDPKGRGEMGRVYRLELED